VIDRSGCTRCGRCVDACPFKAIVTLTDGTPLKCDLCKGEPRCMDACVFNVIRFLDEDDPKFGFDSMPDEEQDPNLGRIPSGGVS